MAERINGIHHIGISVPSLDAARAFYVDMLGFTEMGGGGGWSDSQQMDRLTRLRGTAARMMFLDAGNTYLELFEYASPPPAQPETERGVNEYGYTHLCFDVDDTAAIHARLAAAGIDFHCDPIDSSGVRTVYGRDPFGNVIELQQVVEEGIVQRIPGR